MPAVCLIMKQLIKIYLFYIVNFGMEFLIRA
jgi:hypothetical protein